MPKQSLVCDQLVEPIGHFSHATITDSSRLLFISGMTAKNSEGGITGIGDVEAQTHQVCQNLQAVVEAAGGTMDDIVRVDVYVRNMEDFAASHAIRRQYFKGDPPASTMVEISKFVHKDYLIEINAIAALPAAH
ncbi:RidA family protein [Arthrobacter luteolus]|uniref:RidA family protein n=1 Tax=Arthrobacter luteolus TaxID=98672 RepID=UPI00384FA7DE